MPALDIRKPVASVTGSAAVRVSAIRQVALPVTASVSTSPAVSRGSADTESWTESVQESWSEGKAISNSYQQGRSHGTGNGKSAAAERMVYETTLHWKLRTIVLDFGAGWRKLLNAPGLENRVEIRQLSPGGVRPLRWNPLQIGRNILPEVQWRAFCDVFGAIAKLGVKRQVAEVREALRKIYLRAGVLVDDPECRSDPVWGRVRSGEVDIILYIVQWKHRWHY